MAALVKAFSGLSLGSHRNGICAATRVVSAKPAAPRSLVAASPVVEVEAKLKTHKAAAKRYKVTGSGKVRCRHPGKQHLNEKMSRNTKRRLSKGFVVDDRDLNHVKGQLPYATIKKSGNKSK